MSQPRKHKTVYYTEGQTMAVLVTREGRKRSWQVLGSTSAEALLQWCRANAAALVYMPKVEDPARN